MKLTWWQRIKVLVFGTVDVREDAVPLPAEQEPERAIFSDDLHPVAKGAKPPMLTATQLRQRTADLEVVNRYRMERHSFDVMESFWGGGQTGVYPGGTDLFEPLLRSLNQSRGYGIPIAQPSDRSHGKKWPLWQSDTDLNRFIGGSRIVDGVNSFAIGLRSNLINAIIGKGFTYKVGGRDTEEAKKYVASAGEAEDGDQTPLDRLAASVQSWLDSKFFARNNWTQTSLPEHKREDESTLASGETKEREVCHRVIRDGNSFVRLHYNSKDGTVDARFVDGVLVWGAPAGKSFEDGWSFGIQHKVYKVQERDEEGNPTGNTKTVHDRERIMAYFIRPKEPDEQGNSDIGGEIVPAWEMQHIKMMGEDAEVKHGTPLFVFQVLESLMSAATIRKISGETQAVKAATAELWKHMIGTRQQIGTIQSPGTDAVQGDSVGDGGPGTTHLNIPQGGAVRRMPGNVEPVTYPTTPAFAENDLAVQGALRQAGASVATPEYLISGDASNANYSSLVEAGSPWVVSREADQEHFKSPFQRLMWRVVGWAVECGELPQEAMTLLDISVEAPLVSKDDKVEQASVSTQELAAGITSPQIEIGKRGEDPRRVAKDLEEWKRLTGGQQPGKPPTGQEQDGGPPPSGQQNGAVDPKRSQAAKLAAASAAQKTGNVSHVQESADDGWIDLPPGAEELLEVGT